jgi:ribosome maturation factor RimP
LEWALRAHSSSRRGISIDIYTRERTLEREIAPAVERSLPGVEVLALELLSPSRFCVYVDHPQGVDHALCARVTELLDRYRDDYTIDVSSPGLDRPLRKPGHFRNAVGQKVSLRTRSEVEGRTKFRGEVLAADERAVTLAPGGGEPLAIPYDAIVRGNLIHER